MAKPVTNPFVLPSNGVIAGENIAQWTQDWWTWQVQAPVDTNPLLDSTGDYANFNNDGSIFFLGGSLAQNEVVTRDFSIPHDTLLLAPVMTFLALQYTGTGPDPKNTATGTAAAANQVLHDWAKSVDNLFLRIDGVAVPGLANDLVKTGFFNMGPTQAGSLAEAVGLTGDLSHTKSEGYFAVLKGFAGGDHTIEFGGSAVDPATGRYTIDVVDHVHVV